MKCSMLSMMLCSVLSAAAKEQGILPVYAVQIDHVGLSDVDIKSFLCVPIV